MASQVKQTEDSAITFLLEQQFTKGLRAVERAVQLHDEELTDPRSFLYTVCVTIKNAQDAKSSKILRQTLRCLNPLLARFRMSEAKAEVYNSLACSYRKLGRLEKSKKLLEKCLQLPPVKAVTYSNLCAVFGDLNDHSRALFYGKQAAYAAEAELESHHGSALFDEALLITAVAFFNVGAQCEFLKEFPAAKHWYEKACDLLVANGNKHKAFLEQVRAAQGKVTKSARPGTARSSRSSTDLKHSSSARELASRESVPMLQKSKPSLPGLLPAVNRPRLTQRYSFRPPHTALPQAPALSLKSRRVRPSSHKAHHTEESEPPVFEASSQIPVNQSSSKCSPTERSSTERSPTERNSTTRSPQNESPAASTVQTPRISSPLLELRQSSPPIDDRLRLVLKEPRWVNGIKYMVTVLGCATKAVVQLRSSSKEFTVETIPVQNYRTIVKTIAIEDGRVFLPYVQPDIKRLYKGSLTIAEHPFKVTAYCTQDLEKLLVIAQDREAGFTYCEDNITLRSEYELSNYLHQTVFPHLSLARQTLVLSPEAEQLSLLSRVVRSLSGVYAMVSVQQLSAARLLVAVVTPRKSFKAEFTLAEVLSILQLAEPEEFFAAPNALLLCVRLRHNAVMLESSLDVLAGHEYYCRVVLNSTEYHVRIYSTLENEQPALFIEATGKPLVECLIVKTAFVLSRFSLSPNNLNYPAIAKALEIKDGALCLGNQIVKPNWLGCLGKLTAAIKIQKYYRQFVKRQQAKLEAQRAVRNKQLLARRGRLCGGAPAVLSLFQTPEGYLVEIQVPTTLSVKTLFLPEVPGTDFEALFDSVCQSEQVISSPKRHFRVEFPEQDPVQSQVYRNVIDGITYDCSCKVLRNNRVLLLMTEVRTGKQLKQEFSQTEWKKVKLEHAGDWLNVVHGTIKLKPAEKRYRILVRTSKANGLKIHSVIAKVEAKDTYEPADLLIVEALHGTDTLKENRIEVSLGDAAEHIGVGLDYLVPLAHLFVRQYVVLTENTIFVDFSQPTVDIMRALKKVQGYARGAILRRRLGKWLTQLFATKVRIGHKDFTAVIFSSADGYSLVAVRKPTVLRMKLLSSLFTTGHPTEYIVRKYVLPFLIIEEVDGTLQLATSIKSALKLGVAPKQPPQ